MKDGKVTINILDTEKFRDLLNRLKALVEQVEMNDYKDSNDHDLKMNKAYIDLKKFVIGGFK